MFHVQKTEDWRSSIFLNLTAICYVCVNHCQHCYYACGLDLVFPSFIRSDLLPLLSVCRVLLNVRGHNPQKKNFKVFQNLRQKKYICLSDTKDVYYNIQVKFIFNFFLSQYQYVIFYFQNYITLAWFYFIIFVRILPYNDNILTFWYSKIIY